MEQRIEICKIKSYKEIKDIDQLKRFRESDGSMGIGYISDEKYFDQSSVLTLNI